MGWGAQSGHMQAGIFFRTDGYDTNTPSISVYADLYVTSVGWGYSNDTQSLHYWGQLGDSNIGYVMNSPSGTSTQKFVGTIGVGGQGQSYGGGPVYGVGVQVSGAYDGSAPTHTEYFSLPARPPNTPVNPGMGVDSVGVNTARVVVNATDGRGAGVDAYEAYICSNNAYPGSGGNVVASSGGGTFTANNLSPVTTYYAFARAHNAVGWSAWSGAVGFTTSGNPPAQVGASTVSAITDTGATFTWAAPSNGGSAITYYDVDVADDSGFTTGYQHYMVGNVLSYAYAGAGPGSKKYFRVRAANGVGLGPWSATQNFNTVQTVPSIPNPTEGQVRTDGTATALILAPGMRTGRTIRVQWSQDSTFASFFAEQTLSPVSPSGDDTYTVTNTTAYLASGTWYIRARIENTELSVNTAYTGTRTITQSHAPVSGATTPTGGTYRVYQATVPFVFTTTDPASGDSLTAYQIVVERNDTGAVVTDTGKVALAFATGSKSISLAISSTVKDIQLRWKVRTWDRGDTAGAYSPYSLFYLVDLPAVAITAPGATVSVGSPPVSWTFSATSGRTQARVDASIVQNDTGATVWADSSTLSTTRTLTPLTTILQNNKTYTATVLVTDSQGLQNTATTTFTSSFNPPAILDYGVSSPDIDALGYVLVDWSNATPDPQLVAWRVYRREVGDPTWEMIAEYTDQSVKQYKDFLVTSGKNYLYNVTQVANRFGTNLESPVGLVIKQVVAAQRTNLIKNPNSETTAALVNGTNANVIRLANTTMRGTAFSQFAATAAGDAAPTTPVGTAGAAVVAGTQYVASFNLRRNTGTAKASRAQIAWYNSAGTFLSTSSGAYTTDAATGAIEQRWITAIAPATAAFAAIVVFVQAATASQTFDVDDLLLEVGNTPGLYFDGSVSPDLLNFTPAWTGATNASASTLTEVPYRNEDRILEIRIGVYWIVVPDVPELSTALPGIKDDQSTLQFESATYNIIGRGRHRDYGDRLGYTGSLTVTVRGTDPTSTLRAKVEEMREAQETYWLRTPFGKLFPVALGDIGWSPLAGVGLAEMGELSIPYEEVG